MPATDAGVATSGAALNGGASTDAGVASTSAGAATHAGAAFGREGSAEAARAASIEATVGKNGLDAFLARNTSQDNASFSVLLRKMQAEHRAKFWWAQDDGGELLNGELLNALTSPSWGRIGIKK